MPISTKNDFRIRPEHEQHLLHQGYALIPDFLTPRELLAARANVLRYMPSPEELAATPERYGTLLDEPDAGQVEFPFVGNALNDISTHPRMIALVERLLGTADVLLSQSAIWAKYAGAAADYGQGLHLDYQGNTLVYPRDDGAYRQVNLILYYTNVDDVTLGPTYVVSREHSHKGKGAFLWPPFRTRQKYPDLYQHERPILAKAGSLLVFGMRTFHRASPIEAEAGGRFTHHLVYRAAAHVFQGYHQWSRLGEHPELHAFLERATPRQREVLGFPKPGDPYWNAETLAGVTARYPKMDMRPYHRAVRHAPGGPSEK